MSRSTHIWNELKRSRTAYLFLAPFMICFIVFIVVPVFTAALLSFTSFNSIQPPKFVGLLNFKIMLTRDSVLMKYVIPNTFKFAVFVGPIGYAMQFLLAWLISQLPKRLKKVYVMAIYTPSIAGGVLISTVWVVLFSGDRLGYLNNALINLGLISQPIAWTQSASYLLGIMIFVTIWGSMGVGFLSLFAGLQNVDPTLYEAGKIDGIKNKLQELWYITLPSMKPQMLFAAVMSIVGALNAGQIGVQLSGQNPTPNYAGQLIQNHIDDYGFIRYELGYATALTFMLLVAAYSFTRLTWLVLGNEDDN
ncbi:carbohydrate ABC transporter permease [Paenibacillus taihuensis]|uniref:carbohydrate ABC transporter permease n=1 Tax=Paenibacillus taihuensis TaxID=1156355 RepID=UPI001FEC3FD1|nr:sugar ABC transporter permease [Paenibacillus taihuensis]